MLRITFAELIKILKKPSIYIMGVVLAIVIVVSSFIFKPETTRSYDLNLDTNSAIDSYNLFNGSTGSENKENYDKNFEISESIIGYYTALNTYKTNLKQGYNKILDDYEALKDANTTGKESVKNTAYTEFKNSVKNFKNLYFDFSAFPENSFINFLSTNETFLNSLNNNDKGIVALEKAFETNNSNNIVVFIITNDILNEIKIELNNGLKFSKNAFITLESIVSKTFNSYQDKIKNFALGGNKTELRRASILKNIALIL